MEEGRDSIWSRCQKAPPLLPPPNSGGQKGAEERLVIQQEGHETGQGCTGARAQEGKEEPERFGVGGRTSLVEKWIGTCLPIQGT